MDNLIISFTDFNFYAKLSSLRQRVIAAASLSDGDMLNLRDIVNAVKSRNDIAVIEYTKKFDGVKLSCDDFLVDEKQMRKAHEEIDRDLLASIKKSIENVRCYQSEIFVNKTKAGIKGASIKYNPLRRIGICVPGASAPLPSTVIMTAVPAIVAGVEEIAVVSPPRFEGTVHPTILAVCYELGIKEVYRIGGAQAVAAMAYGTPSIPNVDKIVGPGNQWVQEAKKMVLGSCGIDSVAGPSEVLIIADDSANPAWVAADMLSQAEHSPGSAVLFTDSNKLAKKVSAEIDSQLSKLSRGSDTADCISQFGAIVVFDSVDDCVQWADEFATEHLQVSCGEKSKKIAEKIRNAGAIFIGGFSPVAVGDYFAGSSHTLPTGAGAKFFSALTSNDFVKSISIIEYDAGMLADAAADIIRIAETEGLTAHANSVKIRMEK